MKPYLNSEARSHDPQDEADRQDAACEEKGGLVKREIKFRNGGKIAFEDKAPEGTKTSFRGFQMTPKTKLTDAQVAKGIGWEHAAFSIPVGKSHGRFAWKDNKGKPHNCPPPFTTSLEAIVAEIEARRLTWCVKGFSDGRNNPWAQIDNGPIAYARDTAPLALCAALLGYLKEQPHE